MIGNKHNSRRHPDFFGVLLLVVGMALALTVFNQAQAAAKPVQPRLAGDCLQSLSVVDLREEQVGMDARTRRLQATECRKASAQALRMLGFWAVGIRTASAR